MNRDTLLALAERVKASTDASRELADEVLFACGWQLNHDADEIAGWRTDPGVVEGEDGQDYPVTLAERMTWACWYKPGNRPFRDSWVDGHYRPNPLASLEAATSLLGPQILYRSGHDGEGPDPADFFCQVMTPAPGCHVVRVVARTEALARTAAALGALAYATLARAGDA